MWRPLSRAGSESSTLSLTSSPKPEKTIDGKPERGTWLEPGWRATVNGGAILVSLCLIINISFLIWGSVRVEDPRAPKGDGNPVLFYGNCDQANSIKTWAHLAINIVSTLMLSASTVCMQCLSAPTREEVDGAHRRGKWLDVGILSTRNLRHVGPARILLYVILGLSSIPLHVFYNSVLYTTVGTYDSLTILTTNDFSPSTSVNTQDIVSLLSELESETRYASSAGYSSGYVPARHQDYTGIFQGSDPWSTQIIQVNKSIANTPDIQQVAEALRSGSRINSAQCLTTFQATPLTNTHNVAIVTTAPSNGTTFMSMDFTLAPGRASWTCNVDDWMYDNKTHFFSDCNLKDGNILAARTAAFKTKVDPLPAGYWTIDHCLVQDIEPSCTIVFAKSLMVTVVMANILKLFAMVYTFRYLKFQPIITVGDMVGSFLRRPDIHSAGINPLSNLAIKEAYRYEVSRIYSLEHPGIKHLIGPKVNSHEKLLHQTTWTNKQQRWKSAASSRRWAVTICAWIASLFIGAVLIALECGENGWALAWSKGLGETAPDFVIQDRTPSGQALLGQTVLANLFQILLSSIYIFYSGLLTTMLSARELAAFATTSKCLRVSPPKVGKQRSSYFLQVPYKFAIPVIVVMALLHWLLSQSIFLVRLDEYDILGNLKNASFESVLGYNLRGSVASFVTASGMLLFPIILGFIKLPTGIPLLSHNTLAISIACHPFPSEPENAHEKPLRYGLIRGYDRDGIKRTRVGLSADENVEPLKGGEEFENTRCASTLLFLEHGLEDTCTLDRNSFHLFTKVTQGAIKLT